MSITKYELNAILNFQRALSTEGQADGVYSLSAFDRNVEIRLSDIGTADTLYHKTSKGDYVTVGVIHNKVYTGERYTVWAALTAPVDYSDLVVCSSLKDVLMPGDCFSTLQSVQSNDNNDEYLTPYQYMRIPQEFVGYVTRVDTGPCILTITKSEETLINNLKKRITDVLPNALVGVKKENAKNICNC